jgi:hypothetical protein
MRIGLTRTSTSELRTDDSKGIRGGYMLLRMCGVSCSHLSFRNLPGILVRVPFRLAFGRPLLWYGIMAVQVPGCRQLRISAAIFPHFNYCNGHN